MGFWIYMLCMGLLLPAIMLVTEYYDGSEVPTLPINLGKYSLYLTPAE